jgi:hypothetical protein
LYVENPGSARSKAVSRVATHIASSTAARIALQSGPVNHPEGETLTSMDHYAEGPGKIYVVGDLADAGENGSQPNN